MVEFAIETPRLRLRAWRDADAVPMAVLGADPAVMRYLGPSIDLAGTRALIARQRRFQADTGSCFWALERREDGRLIGFCGVKPGPEGTPLHGDLEIGCRLASDLWGRGYAREAAEATLAWAARHRPTAAVAAMTVPANFRSLGLMERIGLVRSPGEDFDHPALAPGDPLRRHVVYRWPRPQAAGIAA